MRFVQKKKRKERKSELKMGPTHVTVRATGVTHAE